MSDSIASFNTTTKNQIRQDFSHTCAVCLCKQTVEGSQSAHILDSSRIGGNRAAIFSHLGVIPTNFQRAPSTNGVLLCGSCHLGFFTYDHVALSPTEHVLNYLLQYVRNTSRRDQKPLYQVINMLILANDITPSGIPDPTPILPYIGLYTLIQLRPDELRGIHMLTPYFPGLSILQNGQWVSAPAGTDPAAPATARIFDVMAIAQAVRPEKNLGEIPLDASHPGYAQKRYWRLPKFTFGAILSALMWRTVHNPIDTVLEVRIARALHGYLSVQMAGLDDNPGEPGDGGPGDGGPSGSNNSGGGPHNRGSGSGPGSGRGQRKRTGPQGDSKHVTKKQNRGAKNKSYSTPKGGEFPSSNSKVEIDDFDGRRSPPGEEDPNKWVFGPNLSTNTITFYTSDTILDPADFQKWIFQPNRAAGNNTPCAEDAG